MNTEFDYGTFYLPNEFGREFLGFEKDTEVCYVPDLKVFFNEIARNNASMNCRVEEVLADKMQPYVDYPLNVTISGFKEEIGKVTKRKMSDVTF